jgi:hypothetical protein
MNRIDTSGTGIASLGRDEDQFLAHVALGERVVPPVISAATQARINQEMRAAGLDPNEYAVGSGMSINPITGLPEFGFFKKAFKSIKKVAKKAAPLAMFIPGVGSALGALAGGLGTGITSLVGSIPGVGGALSSGLGTIGKAISGGIGSLGKMMPGGFGEGFQNFSQFAEGTGLGGGALRDSLKTALSGGIGGLTQGGPLSNIFSGMGMPGMPQGTPGFNPNAGMPNFQPYGFDAQGSPLFTDGQNIFTEGQIMQTMMTGPMPSSTQQPKAGSFFGRETPRFIKGIEDTLKGQTDPRSASLFKGIGAIPGKIGEAVGAYPGGGFGLGATALLAKAVYDDAKDREGGLSLTPQVTMDALGRYQLASDLGTGGTRGEFGLAPKPAVLDIANMGQRQAFAVGGVAELDLREGGESIGPGTGTSDDIPAMLSDGEFVMTAAATKGAGAFNMKKNKSGIELIKGGKPSREDGVKNMRELMNIFEGM